MVTRCCGAGGRFPVAGTPIAEWFILVHNGKMNETRNKWMIWDDLGIFHDIPMTSETEKDLGLKIGDLSDLTI